MSRRAQILKYIGLLSFLLATGFLLHLPSELAVSLAIPPDSTEYAMGLANLFGHGVFGFTLNGEWYPSRYAPWFSLFCLSPAYFLPGSTILSLHWSILVFALAFLVLSYKMAEIAGAGRWAFVCAVFPLFVPDFVFYCRMVMTEIPYVALFAASALVFVRFADDESPSLWFCLGAGSLVAWWGTVRATALPMLALFAVSLITKRSGWKKAIASIFALSIPSMAYEFVTLMYNWLNFGFPFRSGYNYWMPVPYDFPDLTFSLEFAIRNVTRYLHEPLIAITLGLAAIVAAVSLMMLLGLFGGRVKNKNYLLLAGYVLSQCLVLVLLYVGYFYCDERFFLPVTLCLVPLFLSAVATVAKKAGVAWTGAALIGVVSIGVCCFRSAQPRYASMAAGYPFWIVEAEMTSTVLPNGSVVLMDGNPGLLDYFGSKGASLEMFPLNRDFDYVRYMCASNSIEKIKPRPKDLSKLILREVVKAGACFLPFPETFEENPEKVKAYLKEGRRVFLQRGMSCNVNLEETRRIFETLDRMGLEVKEYGVWAVPEITANPVRHYYDSFIFPQFTMDSRSEVKSVYYEILLKGGT